MSHGKEWARKFAEGIPSPVAGRAGAIPKKPRQRGFTFTISIIVLAVTLIAMALYSQEWRRGQGDAFSGLLPSDSARLEERVSSDIGALLGASPSISSNSTAVLVSIAEQFPFKKEGMPLANLGEYADSLPSSLQHSGAEAILSSDAINGSSAAVANVSDTGYLVYGNGQPSDTATYYHPKGWLPSSVFLNIACGKNASAVGSFSVSGGTDGYISYSLLYSDPSGTIYRNVTSQAANSLATLAIVYGDGTQLSFNNSLSDAAAQNYTSISYTKSPGAMLVLPFNANASGGSLHDYSPSSASMSLGESGYEPSWQPSCRAGGCYSFNGSSYIHGTGLPLSANSGFSIAAWVKADSGQQSGATLLYQLDYSSGSPRGLAWTFSPNGTLSMAFYSTGLGGSPRQDTLYADLSDGNWHMVSLSAGNSGGYAAYLDGAQVSSSSVASGWLNNSQPLFIGAQDISGSHGFSGMVDEVRFYSRALSPSEASDAANGFYQGQCRVAISVSYNKTAAMGRVSAAYNAALRIRRQLPLTVLSLPFDTEVDADNASLIADYSPSLLRASKSGAAWTRAGKAGGAYSFRGQNDRVSVPSEVLSGTGDFTLAAWVKPNASAAGVQQIMGNIPSDASANGVQLALDGDSLMLRVGSQSVESGPGLIQPGSWAHLLATRQSGLAGLYVDGALVGSGTLLGNASSGGNFTVGNAYTYASYFTGEIDEPMVFSRALSDSEVAALYNESTTIISRPLYTAQN